MEILRAKKYILSLHKIHAERFPEADLEEKMNRWVRKEFKNFNEDARTLVESLTDQSTCLGMSWEQIIVMRENDKPGSFSKADFKYLNKNDIEDWYYLCRNKKGVADVLAEYEANRSSGNGDDSHDSGSDRRTERAMRECTYSDFLKCQPLNFKGTEGVIGLTYLLDSALTWWNSHFKTVGHDAAYGMPWKILMKMMTAKYCPRSEIKKIENEIWNLKVKGIDVMSYTQHFQEFALMCGRMFPKESDEVEKYVGGLPDMVQGSVMASKPKTMQDAIEFATELMDQKIRTFAKRQAENKRRLYNNSSENNKQKPPFKRQNVARAYFARPSEKEYAGNLPLCNKCKFHHNGHLTRDCRIPVNNQRTLTCYECGNQGHYRSDFLDLKNRNHGNQAGGTEARRMVYALG
ncbi:retrovirus-related pol polyprotein from transposon 17.6 [Tanacetum coccineum]